MRRVVPARLALVVVLGGLVGAAVLGPAAPAQAQQQDIGHKLLGGQGIHAGFQPPPGLYLGNALVWYGANRVIGRTGTPLLLQGFDLDVFADVIGASFVWRLGPRGPYLGGAISLPLAHVSLNIDRPEASVDRFGLGNLYVQPVKLGARLPHLDLVSSYAFYAPVQHDPGGSGALGDPQWSHEFAAGGTVFFTSDRSLYLSAVASYQLNQRKLDVDITRGDTIQVQGGFGARFLKIVEAGVAGYALWQVRDDSGSDLPPVLRGARDRAFGLGPEILVAIPGARLLVDVRYEHDLAVRSRPEGQILVASLVWAPWRPAAR